MRENFHVTSRKRGWNSFSKSGLKLSTWLTAFETWKLIDCQLGKMDEILLLLYCFNVVESVVVLFLFCGVISVSCPGIAD